MFSAESFAAVSIWIVYAIYFFGLFPQILLNYRLKTAKGISDFMLFGYLAGYVSQLYFIFIEGFPLAYKIMVPMSILAVLMLVAQRFYYDKLLIPFYVKVLYSSLFIFILVFTPMFLIDQSLNLPFGWISAFIWGVYQVPQILKIYKEKSFNGISFKFFTLMGIGVLLELVSSVILAFPIQAVFSNFRALLTYAIFSLQFSLYRH